MTNQRQRWVLASAVILLTVLLLGCIKLGPNETVVTPVPHTPTPFPPTATPVPPTATPVPDAKPEIVDIHLCRGLTDDERPFAETNTFTELDPFVVSIKVANLTPRNIVSVHWYQDDAVIGLTERDNAAGSAYIGLTLEPQPRWVPGDYSLAVSLDGEVQHTQAFSVIGMAALPGTNENPPPTSSGGDWSLYREDNLGFAVEYPAGWLVEEGGSAVQFSHPEDIAVALVMVNANPKGDAEAEAETAYDKISTQLTNAQLTASESQEDGWHAVSFTYTDEGAEVVGVLLSKVSGGRGYHLVFLVLREQWDQLVPTLEQVWLSFQIDPRGQSSSAAADEVMIEGLVRDADTGRGIPYAIFVILREGVSIQQFTDSGNDESLIYDESQCSSDGTFATDLPVRRGTTYTVFAVAKGYSPVVDTMLVPREVSNPWPVTVTMRKE